MLLTIQFLKVLVFALKKVPYILAILLMMIGAYSIYNYFYDSSSKVEASQAELKHSNINVSKLAFGKAVEIGELFGYSNELSYKYHLDQNPDFLNESSDDSLVSKGIKSIGKSFASKEYAIDLTANIKIGYNLSQLTKEDFVFDEHSNTLLITIPSKATIFTFEPQFENSTIDSKIGIFRKDFSDEERKTILADAIVQGKKKLVHSSEIEAGEEKTNDALKNLLTKSLPNHTKVIIQNK